MTDSERLAETIAWLREREANCIRISRIKTGGDRAGWLEDAGFFRDAAALLDTTRSERDAALARVGRLEEALDELFAVVMGECPSLLDEDSGGNAQLYMRIAAALTPPAYPPEQPL